VIVEGRIETTNYENAFAILVSTPHYTARVKQNRIGLERSAVQVYGGTNTAYSTNELLLKQTVR
jgi:hypothetical protein